MNYLVCYQVASSNKNDANGHQIVSAPSLTVESVKSIQKFIENGLRSQGFRSPIVVFTSITKLDES